MRAWGLSRNPMSSDVTELAHLMLVAWVPLTLMAGAVVGGVLLAFRA